MTKKSDIDDVQNDIDKTFDTSIILYKSYNRQHISIPGILIIGPLMFISFINDTNQVIRNYRLLLFVEYYSFK